MIIIDRPYVSDFLKETITRNKYKLLKTDFAREIGFSGNSHIIEADMAIKVAKDQADIKLYTSSENAYDWIANNLSFTGLPQKIDLFKNKRKFRDLIKPLYPDFFYREVKLDDLDNIELNELQMPFIIKPNVGFFSMGVYKVENRSEWESVKYSINKELGAIGHLYPKAVMDPKSFLIEEVIEGEEYAIDAYFNSAGEPIVLGIAKHLFASDNDVSDRVYISSKEIIEGCLGLIQAFLREIGKLVSLRNFPLHLEIRKDDLGNILPIEVNPLRFGGWCTTADMNYFAYGFNPYECFFEEMKPDWSGIFKNKEALLYSVIVLDNSTGIEGSEISGFDYDKLHSRFEHVLELRQIDYRQYPLFGFIFAETRNENIGELEYILKSDLKEFINIA